MKEKINNHFQNNYRAFYEKYLQSVKKVGGHEYQALCPFHEDTKPSFNFNNETGLYFCHGCNKKGNWVHFYARTHGLDTKRDFPKVLKGIASDFGIPWDEPKARIVEKNYDYTNSAGNLIFRVIRYSPKDFRQCRPDGKNGWKWNLKGITPVLYRLPQVIKAQEVIVVEGEKDADNLAALGFTATTCAMGAKKWRDDYNESLKGKDIVLIPDNDNEGREHMTQIAVSLNGTTKSLKWLDLPKLPSKGDVSDWIATFGDPVDAAERLAVMIENADLYHPPKKKSLEDTILTVSDFILLNLPDKAKYLTPWLKENSINLVSGWRGVGKTFFAHAIGNAITKGESFGPWECEKSVPVLILDGEMPPEDVKERIEILKLNSNRKNPLFIYSDALANQWGLPRANLINESWRIKMKSILLARHIKFWIIDNLASLASGLDENAKKDWDPINQWLLELRFAGIATVMLHHVSKEGAQRGTSAREDNLDTSIILKNPPDYTAEDGARFIVHFSKARVATKDLTLISDAEFKFIEDESGCLNWTWGNVKKERKREVLRMLDAGYEYEAICSALSISKGYITKIKKQAINDGQLTQQGKLTQSGALLLVED
jgi:hypothetical protein